MAGNGGSEIPNRHHRALVVYNGPSQQEFRGLLRSVVTVACNWGYRDWPCTDLVAADRLTVAAIVKAGQPQCRLWTRDSSLPLPLGWSSRPSPGIDSGSLAVAIALTLAEEVVVIGADGVCGGDHSNLYHYPWHRSPPSERIHLRHRQALIKVTEENPGRVWVHSQQPVQDLENLATQQVLALFK